MAASDVKPTGDAPARSVVVWILAAALLVAAFLLVLLSGGWVALRHGQSSWVSAAMGSKLFLTCGAILLVCLGGIALLGATLWRAGRDHRKRPRDGQSGAAILEFTIIIPIIGSLAMVMVQSAFLMGGNLCVHYAAYCAARSAVVQIPRDYSDIGEDPNVLGHPDGSKKFMRIKDAAIWAVMPVSAGGENVPEGYDAGLTGELKAMFTRYGGDAPGWLDDRIKRKFDYATGHTFVEVDPPADGERYEVHEDIRVKVEHTLYMSVPYANWLFSKLDDDGVELRFGEGEYGMIIRATCYMPNEGQQDYVDVEVFDTRE